MEIVASCKTYNKSIILVSDKFTIRSDWQLATIKPGVTSKNK
jgi:hypothetical protein